ncbi:MAG: indolepyruvate ferredoxin oxidoreductase family protein, partial [Pseudomonadota bacterium]|nr:indolepyruvate ferredoxin oxidoreductase family protein [Pseudomonadota bacterium]
EGLDEILVVEEKRPLLEGQIKDILFNVPADRRPRVTGKADAQGRIQLPAHDDLSPTRIARVIGERLIGESADEPLRARLARLAEIEGAEAGTKLGSVARTPYFCSGCPHSTSTRVPEGSRALAGIGCHYMAQWMDRSTATYTHMGAEGTNWIGQAPFVPTRHVFQNLGDGTYYHSGLLAIRAAVAAGVNITYKILFNDAVAMTGGQRHDGPLTPQVIADQVRAEGVERIAVVSDDPDKYGGGHAFPDGVTIHHRDELDAVQRELREVPGVSVLIYDQTCAAEKRRRRKRGMMPDPDFRILINEMVCVACGDCSVKSNCLSVTPVETEFGTKRRIDQSSCNKDTSCVNGFCPSFVTVEGAKPRKAEPADLAPLFARPLPEPAQPALERPWNVLVTGVGGTGVVTIGAVLAMAAHAEGKGCSTLDMAGLAQKGGPVTSHVRIAARPEALHATRIAAGTGDLVLGCDAVVAAAKEAKGVMARGRTRVLLNLDETITADFIRNRDFRVPLRRIARETAALVGADAVTSLDASRLAMALLGDSIGANMLMVGFALQHGLLPVSAEAVERAIELNGAAVDMNKAAFRLGRLLAVDPAAVEALAPRGPKLAALEHRRISQSLDEVIERRAAFLTDYQDADYAARYRERIAKVSEAEIRVMGQAGALTEAAAKSLFGLMAYKDEYEVARLYSGEAFRAQLAESFSDWRQIKIHLAPPLLARRDPNTGEPRKMVFGPWMLKLMPWLARLKVLRGTRFDPFGWTHERREERRLVADCEALLDRIADGLTRERYDAAVELAKLPQEIRGFGHVKARALERANEKRRALEEAFERPEMRLAAE